MKLKLRELWENPIFATDQTTERPVKTQRSRMQSATLSFTADHTMLRFMSSMGAGNVIETHEHKGDFRKCS